MAILKKTFRIQHIYVLYQRAKGIGMRAGIGLRAQDEDFEQEEQWPAFSAR
jgi:hypothetical protein